MTTSIMPPIKFQIVDHNGRPASGGKVYSWQTGTNNTPKSTYTDSTGNVANTNPVTLDSSGSANIWLDGYYHIQVYDANGNLLADQDNVSSMADTTVDNSQWVARNLTPTFVDTDEFSVEGVQTDIFYAGVRVRATVSAGDVYGTVSSATSGGTPVITTVVVTLDSGVLDSGLSAIYTGIITPNNSAMIGATYADLVKVHEVLDGATSTPTASKAVIADASGIVHGAELNMTEETSATSTTTTTSLDLGTVTAGDRIFVMVLGSMTYTSHAITYAKMRLAKSAGSTATIQIHHSAVAAQAPISIRTTTDNDGSWSGIIKVTVGGTLILENVISFSGSVSNDAYVNQIYGFFLKKA